MYERFTDRARKVMQLSNHEAQRFNHEYIGTEHMLLGLLKEGSGVAAKALQNLEIDLRKIRLEVERLVKSGPDMVTMGKLPQTPRAKKVIDFAMEEARGLSHSYVGTEHILLGLLREGEGVAAQVLMNLGLKLEDVRAEVLNLLGQGGERVGLTPRRDTPSPERETADAGPATFARTRPAQPPPEPHLARTRGKTPRPGAGPSPAALAWIVLILGIVGLAAGIAGDQNLMLSGAVLIGTSVIALAILRR